MWKIFSLILFDVQATTLALTRHTSNTLITAAAFNNNYTLMEAVCNALSSDNIADNAVIAGKIAAAALRSGYGIKRHTDTTLMLDLATTSGLAVAGSGLTAVVQKILSIDSSGIDWGRSGDVVFSSNVGTPTGFSDMSATYEGKMVRVSATALSLGGSDTHTHAAGTYTVPAHAHTGITGEPDSTGGSGGSGSSGTPFTHKHGIPTEAATTITGTSASGSTVPAFVTLKAYAKT